MNTVTSIISFCTAILLAGSLGAQNLSLKGQIVDKDSKESLIGGHISMLNLADSIKYYAVSDYDGNFNVENLPVGNYTLLINYIGYKAYSKKIKNLAVDLDLGAVKLAFESETLSQVEVKALQQRAVQLGDTTQYNANAYKTNPNANTEDLIKKMPGITVEDGEINAQGEKVTQVLVDGKPYFDGDPNTVLKNLPSGVVSKIQVFDGESEEAQAAGFSDGNTSKTINIILKEEYKKSVFGSVYGSYGYGNNHVYSAGVNVNVFDGDQRITILGQSNNINIQNFSAADLVGVTASVKKSGRGGGRKGGGGGYSGGGSNSDFMVPSQGGISLTNAFGLNYQNTIAKKVDVVGSYFFNHSNNNNKTSIFEDYLNTKTPFQYLSTDSTRSTNFNHRANLKFKYKINKQHQLTYSPSFTYQQNGGSSNSIAQSVSGDAISNLLTQEMNTKYQAFNLRNRLTYSYKFKKPQRKLSLNVSHTLNKTSGDNNLTYNNINYNEFSIDTSFIQQHSDLDNTQHSWQAGASYTEPINKENSLLTRYTFTHTQESYDKFTYDEQGTTDELNEDLSNTFASQYQTHKAEIGHSFRNKKLRITTMLGYQAALLNNSQTYPYNSNFDNVFHSVLPSFRLKYNITDGKNFGLNYRSKTKVPSISDFQNVLDNSNPLQLSIGNPALAQQTDHSVSVRYASTNSEKATMFFANLGTTITQNYVAEANYLAAGLDTVAGIVLEEGVQLSRPVNLSGYSSTRGFMNYGLPITAIKSNLNINLSGNYNRVPTLFNDEKYIIHNERVNLGFVLGSNISENIDFTLSTRSSINFAQSTFSQNTKTFNQSTSLRVVYVFLKSWKIEANVSHQYYTYFEEGLDNNYALLNFGISKYFLKDNQLELYLMAYDILNQNTNITQTYTDYSYQQTESQNLNRYFMVGLRYNFNSLKKAATE